MLGNFIQAVSTIAGGRGSQNMQFTLEGHILFRKRRAAGSHKCYHHKLAVLRLSVPRRDILFGLHISISEYQRMNEPSRSRRTTTFSKRKIFHPLNKYNTFF